MALDTGIRRLASIPLLNELDVEALRLLAFSAETRILRAGDVLFSKGDQTSGGFIVVSGAIALDPHGDGRTAAQIVGPDSLIGEMALITQTECPVTAIARQPSVVLAISRDLLHRVLREFPSSAARLQSALESRLNQFTGLARTAASRSV